MTHDRTTPALTGQGQHISAERADHMTTWWPRSLSSHIEKRTDRDEIEAGIKQLRVPCDPAWLMARVLALLTPYFNANVPEAVRRMEADDWLVALRSYPQWAVEKAVRWWKSDENPDRRRKPIEGDIVQRVKFEMGILDFGAMKVREYDAGAAKRMAEPEEPRPTPEEKERRRAFAQRAMEEMRERLARRAGDQLKEAK